MQVTERRESNVVENCNKFVRRGRKLFSAMKKVEFEPKVQYKKQWELVQVPCFVQNTIKPYLFLPTDDLLWPGQQFRVLERNST
uniref:Uncharacterized protein n=1 Tax=Lepeophtheirus salmonis TaxID=72036 RepID=A0A0K2TTB6_LEPSM